MLLRRKRSREDQREHHADKHTAPVSPAEATGSINKIVELCVQLLLLRYG